MPHSFRPSLAAVYTPSSSLFIENKTTKLAPAVFQNYSSSLNFFTKCTVTFHFWKATVHFVKIKKLIFFWSDPTTTNCFLFRKFLSLLSFLRKFFSLFFFLLSLFSLLFALWGFLLWSTKISRRGLGLIRWLIRWVGWFGGWADLAWAWASRSRRGLGLGLPDLGVVVVDSMVDSVVSVSADLSSSLFWRGGG